MGVTDGAGFHGTDESARSAPRPRTAACGWRFRTSIELYDQVPVGTPVYIG